MTALAPLVVLAAVALHLGLPLLGDARSVDARGEPAMEPVRANLLRRALSADRPAAAWQAMLADRVGVELDALTDANLPPLALAAAAGNRQAVEWLLARGANPNARGVVGSPLLRATTADEAGIVRVLLAAGAVPDERTLCQAHGRTAVAAAFAERGWTTYATRRRGSSTRHDL